MTAVFMISQQLRLPAQKQVNQHFGLDRGGSTMPPPPARESLAADGCWGRKVFFFFFEYEAAGKVTMLL